MKDLKDKNYVRAFGLMTPEEQELLKKVKPENCIVYTLFNWQQATGDGRGGFSEYMTYAIKPDYQPEPEYVDLEIKCVTKDWLGVPKDKRIPNWPTDFPFSVRLSDIPSMPNFKCFWYGEKDYLDYVDIERVATLLLDKKNKVYARFRKGGDTNASIKS